MVLDTFNRLLQAGLFPESWREFLVFFIPKSIPGKFRPISLASCLLKLFERLIHARLLQWLESNSILAPSQFGFRKSKSCQDNLAILTTKIYNGFAKQQYTSCIFVDVSSAFDNVDPGTLISCLQQMSVPWQYCKFIYNLISTRRLYFKIAYQTLGPYDSYKGVPQGCILSPLLYLLYTNDLEKHLHPQSDCLLFADDVVIFSRSRRIEDSIASIQNSLDKVSTYLNARGLSVEPSKSKLVVFSRNIFDPTHPSVRIDGSRVSGCLQTKFLGITLDHRLTWHPHLSNVINKCKKLLNIFKCLRSTWWGADPSSLLTIYRALLRSIIEYGSCTIPLTLHPLRKKIEIIQRRAIRIALGFRNSTPNNIVLAESCEPPLCSRVQFLTDKYLLKIFASSNHQLLSSIPTLILSQRMRENQTVSQLPLLKAYNKLSHLKPLIVSHLFPLFFEIKPSTHISNSHIDIETGRIIQASVNPKLEFLSKFSSPADSIHFYTDGSKAEPVMYVGFAIYSSSLPLPLKYRIRSYGSIFSAEALAISHTIELIIFNKIPKTTIFTDSLSTLQSLLHFSTTGNSSPFIVTIVKNILKAMNLNFQIRLVWIPGHHGIPRNEEADELAKSAISDGVLFDTPLPPSDFFPVVKEKCKSSSERALRREGRYKGVTYFQNYYQASSKPWFSNFKHLNRYSITSFCRMRSNHYNLQASLCRKNLSQSSVCSCGHDSKDLNHILWACPRFDGQRTILVRALRK